MSADFFVRFKGAPVMFRNGNWQPVPRQMATPFVSEAEAWAAASRIEVMKLAPEHLVIESRSQTGAPTHPLTGSLTH